MKNMSQADINAHDSRPIPVQQPKVKTPRPVRAKTVPTARTAATTKNRRFPADYHGYTPWARQGVFNKKSKHRQVVRAKVLSSQDTKVAWKKSRFNRWWLRFLGLICAALILAGLGIEVWYLTDVVKTAKELTDVSDTYTIEPAAVTADGDSPEKDLSAYPPIIDFAALQADNDAVTGWLYIPGTTVNYPILSSSEEGYWLRRDFNGDYAVAGSIFTDQDNNFDLANEDHVIIYGHHMMAPIMFHDVASYTDRDFLLNHRTVYLITPETTFELRVAGSYVAYPNEYMARQARFGATNDFQSYVDDRLQRCDVVNEMDVDRRIQNKMVTMITCANNGTARCVVECFPVAVYPTAAIPNIQANAA